jgi:vancomycin resistance protein VanJ
VPFTIEVNKLEILRIGLRALVRFSERLAVAAAWEFALMLAVWNVTRLYPGDRWLPVRLGNYFAPWLFMALAPALVVALLARRPWLQRLVLLLGLVFLVRYWPSLSPRLSPLRAEGNAFELRVMTLNVTYDNRNMADVAGLVWAEAPDIVAVQELSEELAVFLRAELGSDYPYFVYDVGAGFPRGVFSRYRLTPQSVPLAAAPTQRICVETPRGTVTVWNLHPPPAVHQSGWQTQKRILTAVAEEIIKETGPLIVMGDLNTTDQAQNYHLVAEHLTDVHQAVGRGFGFTFPHIGWYARDHLLLRPVVRIDHILVSYHFWPRSIHVAPPVKGSDHRPVLATLRFAHH